MAGPNRIIKNITDTSITITECGTIITSSGQEDLFLNFTADQITRFDSLIPLIGDGSLVVNDGVEDYTAAAGIRLLFNLQQNFNISSDGDVSIDLSGVPVDFDGKYVYHASPRPTRPWTYTHFTGRSDNLDNSCRGHGEYMMFTVSGNQMVTRDFHFLSDGYVYMRAGSFGWENAPWGTTICAAAVAGATPLYTASSGNIYDVNTYHQIYIPMNEYGQPTGGAYSLAGNPVPVKAFDANYNPVGWWDISSDGLSISYNPTQSGSYDFYDIEIEAARFINHMPIYGTCYSMNALTSDDIEYFPPGYFLRIHHHPPSGVEYDYYRVWGFFFAYRELTTPDSQCSEAN